jgi:ligand-binding SRPBCC domain-containing protein
VSYVLEREQFIAAPRDEVFRFFEDPRNLARITPRWLDFRITGMDSLPLRPGFQIRYRIRWLGLSLPWVTRITEYESPQRFVDVQEKGPYCFWRHEHVFEEAEGGTLMRDRVQYALPFGILGSVAHGLIVSRQLRRIFDYRARRIARMYERRLRAA